MAPPNPREAEVLLNRFNEAQSRLVLQTADLPLGTLAQMVEAKAIDLEPGFQRRERWERDKQSALIESFLLNVPVPPIYLSEEEDGRFTAIDGKQRLRAIADYFHGRFPLRNLESLHAAEGFVFEQLPKEIRNSLNLRPYLRVVTLLKQTDPRLKYEVFLRLNRGGETLNNQEIRNVAFRGALNDAIYKLAEHPFLRRQLKITSHNSGAYKKMQDAEFVLRFLALLDRYPSLSGSLVTDMDDFMRLHQRANKPFIDGAAEAFGSAMERCEAIWGDHAFKRPEGEGWRDQTLAGMYDAQMLAVSQITPVQFSHAATVRNQVVNATRVAFHDSSFDSAVRTGTNTPSRIKLRVETVRQILEDPPAA